MMPSVNGPKAHSISNIIRDIPEENSVGFCQFTESTGFGGIPEKGISSDSDIAEEELGKNYCFIPNFIRPSPDCIEDDDCFGDLSVDVAQDVSNFSLLIFHVFQALLVMPGMLPEPYWDFNMV